MATFGNTHAGSDGDLNTGSSSTGGSYFTLLADGSVTKLTAYTKNYSGTQSIKLLLFSVSGSTLTLLGVTNAVANDTTYQWRDYTFNTPVAITNGQPLALGMVGEGDKGFMRYDTYVGGGWYANGYSYASPGNATVFNVQDRLNSIYATYTTGVVIGALPTVFHP